MEGRFSPHGNTEAEGVFLPGVNKGWHGGRTRNAMAEKTWGGKGRVGIPFLDKTKYDACDAFPG